MSEVEKRMKKSDKHLWDLYETIKQTNIYIVGILERDKRKEQKHYSKKQQLNMSQIEYYSAIKKTEFLPLATT